MADRLQLLLAIFYSLVLFRLADVKANLEEVPANTLVRSGEPVELHCKTTDTQQPVEWRFNAIHSQPHEYVRIYTAGDISMKYIERFSIKSRNAREYWLVISSVAMADSGTYTCVDESGQGVSFSAELTVIESHPKCASNMTSIGLLGANRCGLDPDTVNISCRVLYSGKICPSLSWYQNGTLVPTSLGVKDNVVADEHRVTSSLLIKADKLHSSVSFVCIAKFENSPSDDSRQRNDTTSEYQCQSDELTIIENVQVDSEQSSCGLKSVRCSVEIRSQCRYLWIELSSNKTVSIKRELDLTTREGSSFAYRCQIICPFRGKECAFDSDLVVCTTAKSKIPTPIIITISVVIPIIALIVLLTIMLIWRKDVVLATLRSLKSKKAPSTSSSDTNSGDTKTTISSADDVTVPMMKPYHDEYQRDSATDNPGFDGKSVYAYKETDGAIADRVYRDNNENTANAAQHNLRRRQNEGRQDMLSCPRCHERFNDSEELMAHIDRDNCD